MQISLTLYKLQQITGIRDMTLRGWLPVVGVAGPFRGQLTFSSTQLVALLAWGILNQGRTIPRICRENVKKLLKLAGNSENRGDLWLTVERIRGKTTVDVVLSKTRPNIKNPLMGSRVNLSSLKAKIETLIEEEALEETGALALV